MTCFEYSIPEFALQLGDQYIIHKCNYLITVTLSLFRWLPFLPVNLSCKACNIHVLVTDKRCTRRDSPDTTKHRELQFAFHKTTGIHVRHVGEHIQRKSCQPAQCHGFESRSGLNFSQVLILYYNIARALVLSKSYWAIMNKIFLLHRYICCCMIDTSSVPSRKSSEIFGKFPKMFGNVRLTFGKILEHLRKSSETGRKSSENLQKCRH